MNSYLLIFLGCGIGGLLRYLASNGIHSFLGQNFPYGTLLVNVTGSFLMGAFFVLCLERFSALAPEIRAFLLIGVLGGYTTFSSFSIETINLLEQGAILRAFLNVGLSVTLCMASAWVGIILGRLL